MTDTLLPLRLYLDRVWAQLRRPDTWEHALTTLPGSFRVFRRLIIPAAGTRLATLPWVVVRNDCVFVLAPFPVKTTADDQPQAGFQRAQQTVQSGTAALVRLLGELGYTGTVQGALVFDAPLPLRPSAAHCVVSVADLAHWLQIYRPARRDRKPGLVVQVLCQVEHAMRTPVIPPQVSWNDMLAAPAYFWMSDFRPEGITKSQRDYAFTPARHPQATWKEE